MKQMKRLAALLLAAAMVFCMPLSAFAAGTMEVNEDVSVSDDYDWTRFKGQNMTLNVYNWGEYMRRGQDYGGYEVCRRYTIRSRKDY